MRLDDGFATLHVFSEFPDVLFWEKTVTPIGLSAGGANDTTTMRNVRMRTKKPKKLVSADDAQLVCAYDPAVLPDMIGEEEGGMLGLNQEMLDIMPEGDAWAYWGWVDSFKVGAHTEGEQPTATIVIMASNEDDENEEVAPRYLTAEEVETWLAEHVVTTTPAPTTTTTAP